MNINNKKKQLKKEVKENKRGMNLKILRILLIALSLIIILMNFVSAVTNVTNCSTLSTANTYYQLNRSIVDIDIALSTDCIIISAQNITFDCNGYYISQSENVSGIYSNQYNTTIRNCNITIGGIVGSNSEAKGIELVSGTSYGTIYNNTARADVGYGIYLTSSASNNLTSNIGISTSGSGIFMTTNSNNNILINNSGISNSSIGLYLFSWAKNNILINNSGISNSSQGISLNSVCDNNILTSNIGTSISGIGIGIQSSSNNTLTSSTGTSNSSIGIYLLSSNNNTLTGNNGTSYATSGNVAGINIWASSSNNLTGNIGTGNKVSGIFFIYAENNILINSTGTSDSGNGIFVWDSSKNSILINNTGISNSGFGISLQSSSYSNLTGNIGTSNSSYGTAIWTASNNNLFSHRTEGYLTGSYGFYITSSSANNTIQDCINASGVLKDVFVGGNSVNNIFINCSYTLSKEQVDAGSYLTRKWFYKAYVNDSLFGTDISGANVSAYNVSSALEFFLLTNSSGWTNRTEITEYVNYGGTRNYYNNYTLSAEKTGYATSSKLYNVTNVNGTEGVNNYLGDYFSLSDNSAPNATLILANNTYASNYSVNFTANITDNVGIKNATLNVYNSTNNLVNQTNQSYSTGVVQSTLGIVITLINGVYKWFYEIFDWQGNQYTTANYTLNMYLVSDCQTLSTAGTTYYLNQSISNDTITGDCMIVSAQNITLDCQGYSIASIQNFSGVYSNQYNTTIRNCNVTMGGSSGSNTGAIGIEYVQGANYGTIYNNTAKSDIGTGISLKCISNSTMYNNTGTSNTGYGIVFSTDYCSGNNNNNITKNTGISNSSYGILIASAGYEYVDSNIGTSTSSYGIYYQNHNSIIRNNIGSSITSIGMGMIYSVANITFENNTGSSISSYGIDLFCANSTMTGNTGTSNTSTGIFIYSRDSIIKNNIGISNGSNGISFAGYGYGIKGTNLTLINNTGINAKYVTSWNLFLER